MVSRRDFLKVAGLGLAALAANKVNASLLSLSDKVEKNPNEPSENPLGYMLDVGYPMKSWVVANTVVAMQRLNGQILPANGRMSLLDALFGNDPMDETNRDPRRGFVVGKQLPNPLTTFYATGICKAATDFYRTALQAPVLIEEGITHTFLEKKHPFFKNYPFGTDASIYLDREQGVRYDVIIKNPLNFPVKLEYRLFDGEGKLLDTDRVLSHKINEVDLNLGFWHDLLGEMEQVNLPVKAGFVPTKLAVQPVTTAMRFIPVGEVIVPPWKTTTNFEDVGDKNVRLTRTLEINNKIADIYTRVSNYQ